MVVVMVWIKVPWWWGSAQLVLNENSYLPCGVINIWWRPPPPYLAGYALGIS